MLHKPYTRRLVALALLATGGLLFLLAPENAWISLAFVTLGILLEIIGVWLKHQAPD